MKPKDNENSYIVEDINTFCSSVKITKPVYTNKTFSISVLGSTYCESLVEQNEGKK